MRAIEIARLHNLLDRLDAGESNEILVLWVERQFKIMGEQDFQQWFMSEASQDLGPSLYQRFSLAILAHLSELETQFKHQNGIPVAQYLIMEGFEPGTDFSGYDGGVIVSEQANQSLQRLGSQEDLDHPRNTVQVQ